MDEPREYNAKWYESESGNCSGVSNSVRPHELEPGSLSVHGILQARILEWVAMPSPGDLPTPGIKPGSPALQANSFIIWGTWEAPPVKKTNTAWLHLILYIQHRLIHRDSLSGVVGSGELIHGYSFSSATWKQFCRLATKEHEYT